MRKRLGEGVIGILQRPHCGIEREKGCAKISFSSRHYPILALDTIPTIPVEERSDKDIRWFLQDRLKEIEPKATRQQIETEILLKAHGGFQWIVLITDAVIDGHASAIKAEMLYEKLRTTPEALDDLYSDILSKVASKERHKWSSSSSGFYLPSSRCLHKSFGRRLLPTKTWPARLFLNSGVTKVG
ncbi:hypothetical protein B0I35DRAFT_500264 [Stachybotrys elegans]|uniref:Uncharacterized protein n=1 Tax=Stachybotrys elegans TaxID=80388 RepID=A0A8K0SFS5_9HYPO|nr:hypothetical protein B0I35DRAFT_500264 [Stachybotrys elegans]